VYDIYKTILPVKALVLNQLEMDRLRQLTVEAYLDKASFEIARRLRPGAVAEQVKTANPEEFTRSLEADLNTLIGAFDKNRITAINRCYSLISVFIKFVNFDYAALLKQFDSNFSGGDETYIPKFTAVKAAAVVKDIENFRSAAALLNSEGDWNAVLGIIKVCLNGVEPVPVAVWQNLVMGLRDVQASNIMDQIIQLALKDPLWQGEPVKRDESLAESWIEAKQTEIGDFISNLRISQRNDKMHSLAASIFGTAGVIRLHYYTLQENAAYIRNGLDGFIYVDGLNYLEAFLTDYMNKEVQELCEILLIRGQWTAVALSREMSEGYNQLKEIVAQIEKFDETLSDMGKNGSRLKSALARVGTDRSQIRYINSITSMVDAEALNIINTAAQSLIMVGKHLKNLYDDYQKNPHELILNWRELNMASSRVPIVKRIGDAYKKINYFIQLMQLFANM
jgi:hypothetical protein